MINKLFATLIVISLCGCMSEKKATDYLKKKDKLDDVCAAEFPVKETFIKGKDSISFDTMFLETLVADTVKTKDTIYITKALPQKVVTITKMRVDTFKQRDFSQENVLMDKIRGYQNNEFKQAAQIDLLKKQVDDWKGKAVKRFWLLFLIIGSAAGYIFRKPIGGLFKLLKFSV